VLRKLCDVRPETISSALVAVTVSLLLVAFGPPARDISAHVYRTLLVEDGVLVWDALWYGGHYPLASYSLLYYFPAALIGNVALGVLIVASTAALFASVVTREWGPAARYSAWAFAVVGCAPILTGTYPFAAGLAALLGSLRLLQAGRTWLAGSCAVLTLMFSPLAFGFLCLVLFAAWLVKRPPGHRAAGIGLCLAAAAAFQLVLITVFREEQRYPFGADELVVGLLAAAIGIALSLRAPRTRLLTAFFGLWALACLVAFFAPTPIGSNLERLRYLILPLTLVPVALTGFRPRWLALPAVALALVYNASPFVSIGTQRESVRVAEAAFWEPALDFLRDHADPSFRVDVVPTFDHWQAYYVPRAGFALTRGWFRQLDLARNDILYEELLTAQQYRDWLRSVGARYVLLPDAPLNPLAAEEQGRILRSGDSGLAAVFETSDWTIYELPDATPILTGPGPAQLTELSHARIAGTVGAPGEYLLRVRYTPFLAVSEGDVCLDEHATGMIVLRASRPGSFALAVPGPGELVRIAFGSRPAVC
jgi:hypothetical membrane protein